MTSLNDMKRLLQVGEHRQLQNEHKLIKARKALSPLSVELSEIDSQVRALNKLLESHQSTGVSFDHSQLLAWLKHQAVIRRQLSNARLDRARVVEQYNAVTEQIEQFELRNQGLQKKRLLYVGLYQRLRGEYRLNQRRHEDNEIEELLMSMK
jgi:hypothetical protein